MVAGVGSRRLTELVRRAAIVRVARGVYAVGERLRDPASIAGALLGVLSFESAAAWYGADLPSTVDSVHVTVSRNRGRRVGEIKGVRLHRADLRRGDVRIVRGVAVTSPLRTALDLARHLPLEHAVAIIDSLMRQKLLTAAAFEQAARRSAGPGRRRIQMVAKLVDHKSGSVLESLTRVLLFRHGVRPPRSQHVVVHAASGWRGRLDFAWPQLRVALECDGYEFHAAREPFQGDRRRWSTLSRAGWHVGVVTWFDVTRDPAYVVQLVRDLLALEAPLLHTNVTADVA